ncbi:MAG: DNA repair exonuclease [Bacillati bacterium ANGP1]|uniref:DNA repair exonuclease n=1 Tax=Candidatus Segetimicrobium genomatis TaxID=2569760 RepID=A0A537MA70_9BACT|nr:MAG: DNA repair exonuclease [Terrabacteria group bacterium ANGP1]
MSLRILHTADVHLGATFRGLGDRGREQRRQLEATFAQVVRLAIEERVNAVVIAGDLFDSVAAARAHLASAAQELRRLGEAAIPVCAIAGNHDPLGEGSASVWGDLAAHASITVFGPQLEARVFADLDLTVVGCSRQRHLSAHSPLSGLPVARQTRFVVALAHGSVERPDLPAQFGQITREEIARSEVDYLALGDWHSTRDVSAGGVSAWYSGAPEMIDLDEPDSGNVCVVTLDAPGRVEVDRRRVGRRRGRRLVLDVATLAGAEAVERAIRAEADPDLALNVVITGLASLGECVSAERVQEDLAGEFFRLRILDESHVRPEAIDPAQFPENTVLGRFVRMMQAELAGREGDARTIAEDALHWGVALLQGKELLS